MKLLEEIIASSLSSDQKLPDLLRKCLVLAYQLNNDLLKEWVEKELNGYGGDAELPDYRKIFAGAKGLFLGPYNAQLPNQPIASVVMEPEHRHFAERVEFRQPIAAYDEKRADKLSAVIQWPQNLVVMYQAKFYDGYALNRAWQEIPGSTIASLVDTVRTKILSFALEIKKQLGAEPETQQNLLDIPTAKVNQIVNNYIYGGQNVIAAQDGQMIVDARTQVVAGDLETLRKALQEFGVDSQDVALLEDALAKDTNSGKAGEIGPKTSGWLSNAAKKVGGSTVKVSEGVATTVISGMIKGFLGY